ncbi:hypothetical protein [Clostridium botulinum]|uniref:hypothetical protein n=1 Tax=Clostridium botulinum TaxID=1491 RepID=UPI0018D41989|nr:hypothetical protein [Clostridium botulinum]
MDQGTIIHIGEPSGEFNRSINDNREDTMPNIEPSIPTINPPLKPRELWYPQ